MMGKVNSVIYQDELMEMADAGQKKTLVDWLNNNGIVYMESRKGRVRTTIEAINKAMMEDKDQIIEFGDGTES